jgi:serine/threonine protein phosphatase PrpC
MRKKELLKKNSKSKSIIQIKENIIMNYIKRKDKEKDNHSQTSKSINKSVNNNTIKRSKAKSNNLNHIILKELTKNGQSKEKSIYNNYKNSSNSLSKSKNSNIIKMKTERTELNSRSPHKNNNILIKKEKLNKSTSNENIAPSDIEDDNTLKIPNFGEKIKMKNRNLIFSNNDNNIGRIEKTNKDNIIILKKNKIISNLLNNQEKINKNSINLNTIKIKNNNEANEEKESNEANESKHNNVLPNNYFRCYKSDSVAGTDFHKKKKTNQDIALTEIKLNNIDGFNLFGVLDGHGEFGHKVSRFARDFIKEEIQKYFEELKITTHKEIYMELTKDGYSLIKRTYEKVDEELSKQQNFNANFSGTTCIIVFQIGNYLISANVGDSRAIIISSNYPFSDDDENNFKNAKIFELSRDQKPNLPEEKKRIEASGGIVDQMLDSKGKKNGPYRVWAGRENYPGLAMSRSIGDLKGKECGLIAEPEIIEFILDDRSKYMIICSDGVWEFLSNENVMEIANKCYIEDNIDKLNDKLIKKSQYWWDKEDVIRDDITVVTVFF